MFPLRGAIAPKMKINIKRIPDESTQIINGKANCLVGNSEPEMIVTLIGNPKGFCKSTQTRLKGNCYRLLIELKKISPECCQKIEALFNPRIRMNVSSSLAVDIILKRFTNTEIKLVQ
jgi:hypothetical protein